MDIGKIDHLCREKISTEKKVDGNHRFKQIFEQKLSEIDGVGMTSPVDNRIELIKQGDKLLNLLDNYARELADPNRKLKDIDPLVNRIQKEVSRIESSTSDNIYKDKELEKIIKDLAVTANVAAYKFHRGDYL